MTPDEAIQEIEEWLNDDSSRRLGKLWRVDEWLLETKAVYGTAVEDETARCYITGWLQESCKDIPRTEKNADLFYAVDYYCADPGFLSALWELHKDVEGIKVG